MFRKITLSAVITALAAFGIATSFNTASAQQNTQESASGQGTLLVDNGQGEFVRRQFSFSARRNNDGTVSGRAIVHNAAFTGENGKSKYQAQFDISCMKIVGNIAIFGGRIRRTNDPSLMDTAYFSVQDNGEPGKNRDKISLVHFFDNDPTTTGNPALCEQNQPTDFPLETIESGNISVRGGTTP
ncbi:MAG TPA: hypothetical protein VF721_00585 [Pyrinomonadaceae bacterium]|jgi:hypothetical protein